MQRPHGRAAFAFIFVTVALDMLALGIVIPVLPNLLIQMKGGDMAAAASVSGVFGFTWAAMQFVFSPLLGALSDRFGRRPVVLLSNVGLGLDSVLMATAPTLSWLFAGRVISGITSSSFPTAAAYVSDVTPAEQRAARFGLLGAAFGLGFVIGPALGGVLGGINLRLPFWVAAGLSLANAAYGYFVLPESLPPQRRSPLSFKNANPLGSLRLLRSYSGVLSLAAGFFLFHLAHESLPAVFVLYTDFRYGWTPTTIGLVLAVVGACWTAVSAGLVGPAVSRLGERSAMLLGLAFGVVSFMVYGLAPSGRSFMLGIPLLSLWSISEPAMQGLLTRRVAASEHGQLQGALSSLRGVTGMIGPLLFTQTFAAAVAAKGAASFIGAPYLLASSLVAVSLAWTWLATREAGAALSAEARPASS